MKIKLRGTGSLEDIIANRLIMLNPEIQVIPVLQTVLDAVFHAMTINQPIFIVGDYDVDGITATAILIKLFEFMKKQKKSNSAIFKRLPKRISEGYGINVKIIDEVPENALLITVDNGIVAFDAIKKAKEEKKCTVIIIDHHLGAEDGTLPDADVICDPNAIHSQANFTAYCGAGLCYKLATLLRLPKNIMEEIEGLAALATVADCVPLTDENWLIARNLNSARTNPAIRIMCERYQILHISEGDAGFKICPTINASGRLLDDGAEKVLEALLAADSNDLIEAVSALISKNEERKALTDEYLDKAIAIVENNHMSDNNCINLVLDMPEGLVGILAGRIAEKYMCPSIVLAHSHEDGILKGSARSYGNNHLKKALDSCKDLLTKYGGHAAAAGLSLPESNFNAFDKAMNGVCSKEKEDVVYYDVELNPNNIQYQILSTLNALEEIKPFGESNPEPVFLLKNVRLYPRNGACYKTMGADNQHLKLYGKDFDIVYFGEAVNYLAAPYERVNVVGKIGINHFNGKDYFQIEALYVEEAKPALRKTKLQDALNKRASERM